eukprot:CAMPEP_0113867354 /NCGR_PEP_ID=MMETSP0780_2-20120614/373_1 /TAXON_ID=652834 /ORGANISM="Palpitomonas bilix" /LENGTH=34 /DNA_ID=CAMNT_0000852289 /DNA_START=716 /DNA_END=816 /DNA_ORIENTATION=- /assembly_acc=CAM_ASM_000599
MTLFFFAISEMYDKQKQDKSEEKALLLKKEATVR